MVGSETSPACAHCGSVHESLAGLRSHIVQGRCRSFNPQACAEHLPIEQAMVDACLHGKLGDLLFSSLSRMHLTIHCAQCGRKYERAADLALHLQGSHSRLWRRAQLLTQALVQSVYSISGCQCNPKVGHKRSNHICIPLRQVAMIFHRLQQEPFVPKPVHEKVLPTLFAPTLPGDLKFKLAQLISDRLFSPLWLHDDMRQALSTVCIQCGERHSPAALYLHLHQVHLCRHINITFYMEQLQEVLRECFDVDHCCIHCRQIFNVPASLQSDSDPSARVALAQTHLAYQCPNLLQISVLLGSILYGGRLGYAECGTEQAAPDPGHFPGPSQLVGQGAETVSGSQTVQEAQGSGAAKRRRRKGSFNSSAGKSVANHDPTSAQTRKGSESAAPNRHIYALLHKGTHGTLADTPEGDPGVEAETGSAATGPDATSAAPLSADVGGSTESLAAAGEMSGGGRGSDCPAEEGTAARGRQLAISPVGSPDEDPLPDQQDSDQHGQVDATPDRAPGHGSGPHDAAEISEPRLESRYPGAAMEDSIQPASQRGMGSDGISPAQQCLGVDGMHNESTHGQSIRTCHAPSEAGAPREEEILTQGQGERLQRREEFALSSLMDAGQLMQYDLMHLRLSNPSNWCYANSTFFGVMWTLGCLDSFDPRTWGFQIDQLVTFLRRSSGAVATLMDEIWFQQLLQSWDDPDRQHDCSEFVSAFLIWLNVPVVNMSWQRRIENSGVIQIMDESSRFMPLVLQLTDPEAEETCTLSQLFRSWHQVHGMCAAVTEAAPVLCIHLDRMYFNDREQLLKSQQKVDVLQPVDVPQFEDSLLRIAQIDYVIVGFASHTGHAVAGHSQAAMKTRPSITGETTPFQWMISQDSVAHTLTWNLPDWMVRNSTTFWLVRLDCLALPHHQDWHGDCDFPIVPSVSAIMSMLQQRHGNADQS